MKLSYHPVLIRDDSGVPYAIFAPADFTAEHEQELTDVYWILGCDPNSYKGLYSFSLQPNRTKVAERSVIVFEENYSWRPEIDGKLASRSKREKALCMRFCVGADEAKTQWLHWRANAESELSVSYGANGFEVMAYSKEAKQFLNDLKAAISASDFACFRGGGSDNPFSRGGLVVTIPSRVPEEKKTMMREAHEERKRLLDAAKATGIEDRIRARNGEPHTNWRQRVEGEYTFYALKPAWAGTVRDRGPNHGGKVETKHEVIFFLNPSSPKARCGWFTVEELDEWIAGTGPVFREPEPTETPAP